MFQLFVVIVIIVLIFAFISAYWYVVVPCVFAACVALAIPPLVRHIRKNRYFSSDDFRVRKEAIAALVAEHNEIAEYAKAVRDNGTFDIAFSASGEHAHLASSHNTSSYKYRRDRNVAHFNATNVHNCSLQVVRNASQSPIKYLIKYFHISVSEGSLGNVEALGEQISRLESAIANIKDRESSIATTMTPPEFILRYYRREFMEHVGVTLSAIRVPYPVYVFEYVSAGGNSGQRTTVTLDTQTIDTLIEALSEKIRFRKSAAGQRALMTTALRERIKRRDNYTCHYCGVAVSDEPHLLLEIDHIVPVSKGGTSTEANLQTLCWRCNRAKSNKLVGAQPVLQYRGTQAGA